MVERMHDYVKIYPLPDYGVIKARPQIQWRLLIAVAFYCCGLGAGTYMFSLYYGFTAGMIIGYLTNVVVGTMALFFDAGHGFRVWRAWRGLKTSWISRGVVFITSFGIFGFLSIIGHLNLFASFSAGSSLVATMDILTVIFGLAIMFYSGFVISFSPAVPFWNNAVVPVIFLLYSFLGGLSLLLAASPFFPGHGLDIHLLERVELVLILLTIFAVLVYLVNALSSVTASKLAAISWLKDWAFWIGVVVVGLILPLVLGLYSSFYIADPNSRILGLAASGFMELIGGFIFRVVTLNAGYYSPLFSREWR